METSMMHRPILVAAVLITLAVGLGAAQASVAGKWNFTVQFEGGSGAPTVVFTQDGETLSGTYTGQLGEAPLTGTLKDKEIVFRVKYSVQGYDAEFVYSGTLESETTMKGTVDLGGMASGTWTGKKAE
jgi:FlaG/FlaF family flagellin (archaellin)